MVTHSNMLAWKMPWTRGDWQAIIRPQGCKESDRAEWLSTYALKSWFAYKIPSYAFYFNFMTNPHGGNYCLHLIAKKARVQKSTGTCPKFLAGKWWRQNFIRNFSSNFSIAMIISCHILLSEFSLHLGV